MKYHLIFVLLLSALLRWELAFADADKRKLDCEAPMLGYYSFSWPLGESCDFKPRGGTSKGSSVVINRQLRTEWRALQETDLTKLERDRRAILAMSGGYRVDFDFLETIGFSDDYTRDRPYQSWGTEYVYVLENEPRFISLQHVLVMYFEHQDGTTSEPMIMKHWRQDWTYEGRSLLEFQYDNQWHTRPIPAEKSAGKWTQSVYQVDDSPRYAAIGEWQHNGSFSSWKSSKTRRPLPRREFSVRQDYDVLEGFNTHVITRNGWVQVEENWKLVVDDNGDPDSTLPYLSKEQGVARYQSVVGVDFSPGDQYMATAGRFWSDVRDQWALLFKEKQQLTLKRRVDEQPLFMPLFEYAEQMTESKGYDSDAGRAFAREVIRKYVAE